MSNKINVYTIDDEVLFLLDLKSSIQNGIRIVGYNSDAYEALADIERMHDDIDVVVCDINLGTDIDGLELAQRVHIKYPIPFVFISAHYDLIQNMKNADKKLYDGVTKPIYYSELIAKINRIYELNN